MSSRLRPRAAGRLALALVLAACGGNYSNEDVEFQLALPSRAELAVKLPRWLDAADAAEYYQLTRAAVRTLDELVGGALALADDVRAYAPTRRDGARRVWGPVRDEQRPAWETRVAIEREGPPLLFAYVIEVRPRDGEWQPLVNGWYRPAGAAPSAEGELTVLTAAARAAGYPLGRLDEVDELRIEHRTRQVPANVEARLRRRAGPETRFSYSHDGSGRLVFDWPTADREVRTRWLGSGAGRADARTPGGAAATDCWGIDARPTFVARDGAVRVGAESSCVFPAP